MAHRRETIQISMFPFLSVLCTVIGVMVLFIVLILSTRVVEVEERYQFERSNAQQMLAGSQDAILEGIDSASFEELQAELERLTNLLVERTDELNTLERKLSGLEDLLEFKKTELLVQVTTGPPRELAEPEPVAIVPDEGYKVEYNPVFVEVQHDKYVVYPEGQEFPAKVGAEFNDDDAIGAEFRAFLKQMNARRRKEYLVFLIHPNGVAAFDAVRYHLAVNYEELQMGWEPFNRAWIMANAQE